MRTSDRSSCTPASLTPTDATKFNFLFTTCRTPTLTGVTFNAAVQGLARSVSVSTVITATGSDFSNQDCANDVTIGDCACTVSGSSAGSLNCVPDAANCDYEMGILLPLAVNVKQWGYAKMEASDWSMAVVPKIDSISPIEGSLAGGSLVTLQGYGFNDIDDIAVYFNDVAGDVISVNPLVVRSPLADSGPVTASVSGFPAVCADTCLFSYKATLTPEVSDVTPTEASGATTFTITGNADITSATEVFMGNTACTSVSSGGANQITCSVAGLPAGLNAVKVYVPAKGFALTTKKVTGTPTATVSPTTGSTNGGSTLTFTGHGFDGETTIMAGALACNDVTVVSLTEVTCVSPPNADGAVTWVITSHGVAFPGVTFTYDSSLAPTITDIAQATGDSLGNQVLTITGNHFHSGVLITVCDKPCVIEGTVTDTQITCVTPPKGGEILFIFVPL